MNCIHARRIMKEAILNTMREKLSLPDEIIIHFLQDQYGLQALEISFLPQSGDAHAAVYRVTAKDHRSYFLKFIQGVLDETSVRISRFLSEQGIRQVIAPISSVHHQPWTQLAGYSVILYPFIEGHNAFEVALTEPQWVDFGAALKGIHTTALPLELARHIEREAFSPA